MPLSAGLCISSLLAQSRSPCLAALLTLWQSDGLVKSLLVSTAVRLGLRDLEWPWGEGTLVRGSTCHWEGDRGWLRAGKDHDELGTVELRHARQDPF